jgi:two-component system sensor histidine kinase VicK
MTQSGTVEFAGLLEIGDIIEEGLIIYNQKANTIKYINDVARNLLKLRENAEVKDLEAVLRRISPDDKDYVKNRFLNLNTTPVVLNMEVRLIDEEKLQYICCNAYSLLSKSTIVVFLKDISKSKTHENYLVEFGARKNTSLDTLAHHMSGALNLMLHLSGEAEKYIDVSANPALKKYLNLVNENSKRCIEMIHDLMLREHDRSPDVPIKNARIDIVEKVRFLYDELQESYINRKLFFHATAGSILITTDEVKLLQVVNNLLSNSIKFTLVDQPISIRIQETESSVIVSVQDQGTGIPLDLQPFVFDPNGGAGRTGLNGEKSIGLGLSICKNLTERLDGQLWFESIEGKGSTFYLKLPKSPPN